MPARDDAAAIRSVVSRAIVALVLALAAGCLRTIPDSLPPGQVPGTTPGMGVVVGSVTAPADERYAWMVDHLPAVYDYRSLSEPRVAGSLRSARSGTPRAGPGGTGDRQRDGLEESNGRLFAVELPPDGSPWSPCAESSGEMP